MAALQRALPLAKVHSIAMLIGQDLRFDVARVDDRLLDIDFAVTEGAFRFAARRFQRRPELRGRLYQAHALAAPASRGFQHDRIADPCCHLFGLFARLQSARGARYNGNSGTLHRLPRARLRPHRVHCGRRRTDELYSRVRAGLRELCILGEESVARMDGIGARALGDVENFLNV